MVNIVTGSAKLGVDVPELNRKFKNYIFDIAGLCFSCSLVFDVDVMSVVLNTDNPVSRSPLQVPFAWLFVFEVYMISHLKGGVVFSVAVNLFSSSVFFTIANASLCVSKCICQSQDLPGNVASVPGVGEVANWGLCHKPKRRVTLQWLGWV